MTANWKDTARVCTACGVAETFPTETRYGTRHDCRGCGRWAWGDEGMFGNRANHRRRNYPRHGEKVK